MKLLGRILLGIVAFVVAMVVLVLAIRFVNGLRYPSPPAGPDPRAVASYTTTQPGMTVTHVEQGSMNGFHLKPEAIRHQGVVITYGGSEGSPDYQRAVALAKEGYEVLSLFFWGQGNQTPTLKQVPLEGLDEVVAWVDAHAVSPRPITLIGGSKGAEYALLEATRSDRVDNVILFAPASHAYPGLDYSSPEMRSSWTQGGQDVPFITFEHGDLGASLNMYGGMLLNYPIAYRGPYETSEMGTPDPEPARIKVERFDGKMLVFAGAKDMMWQSDRAAEIIRQHKPDAEVHVYPDAGHLFGLDNWYVMGLAMGGTADGNKQALDDSRKVVLERLAAWHPAS